MTEQADSGVYRMARRGIAVPMRGFGVIALQCSALAAAWHLAAPVSRQGETETNLERLVIVADRSVSKEAPGCGSIALFDVETGEVHYRHQFDSVGIARLDVDDDAQRIVASPAGVYGLSKVHMHWQRMGAGWDAWRAHRAVEPPGLHLNDPWQAIAFVPGTTPSLLAPINQTRPLVASFDAPGFQTIESTLGEELLEFPWPERYAYTPGWLSTEILVTRDGRIAHTLDRFGNLSTIDLLAFEPAAAPMAVPPFVPDAVVAGDKPGGQIVYADLSVDERYLVTNRWNAPELGVTDLQRRTSRTVSAGAGITMTGEVAFNHGWENTGLLAVHALSQVVVYRFHPDGELEALSQHPVEPVTTGGSPVPAAIAWSARGDRLIAATNHGANDFAIFDVLECGRRLVPIAEIAACPDDRNQGFVIWTANKRLAPPEGHAPRCPRPDERPTATPPPPPVPSATPFATPLFDDPLRDNEGRMTEEGVVFLDGSAGGALPGCDGLTFFATSVGRPMGHLDGLGEPGRIAQGWGLSDALVGPVDDGRPSYRAVRRVPRTEHGTTWSLEVLTPTFGAPLPYGAMTRVWGDSRMLLAYRDRATGAVVLGVFGAMRVGNPVPEAPYASLAVPRGIPAAVALEKYFGDGALNRSGGTGWVVTDLGEVWRLTYDGEDVLELHGPVAVLGPPPAAGDADDGPVARRVHAALTHDERHLLVSRWGRGEIDVVELATGAARRVPAGDGLALAGQLATNRAWENDGLVALHAGDHVVVYATDPVDGTPIELARHGIEPSRDARGQSEPGSVAWSTNGLALFATSGAEASEVVAFRVDACGRRLEVLYRVPICDGSDSGSRGRAILTANQGFVTRADYQPSCPAGVIPPTLVAPEPTATVSPPAQPMHTLHLPFADRP